MNSLRENFSSFNNHIGSDQVNLVSAFKDEETKIKSKEHNSNIRIKKIKTDDQENQVNLQDANHSYIEKTFESSDSSAHSMANSQNLNPNLHYDQNRSSSIEDQNNKKKRKAYEIEESENINNDSEGHINLKRIKLSYDRQTPKGIIKRESPYEVKYSSIDTSLNSEKVRSNKLGDINKEEQLINNNDLVTVLENDKSRRSKILTPRNIKQPLSSSKKASSKPHTPVADGKQINGFEEEKYKESYANEKRELLGQIKDLEQRLKESNNNCNKFRREMTNCQEYYQNYQQKVKNLFAKFILDHENLKRKQHKAILQQQKLRLGEFISQREGGRFIEIWVDGLEIRQAKEKLNKLIKEKDEAEAIKKSLKPKKSSVNTKHGHALSTTTIGQLLNMSNLISNINHDSLDANDNAEFRERVASCLIFLSREEQTLKEKLEKLELEKLIFLQEYKRQFEEDHSRFGKINRETNAPAWPILKNRYQLLSLLGKGGFSEVYKAFDLDELTEVACKVHQLNPVWTENAKENYIKHAEREAQIHHELSHPNIVKLYDRVDIDHHTFAVILEYCEGPDLSLYLKKYKVIPEKDAKVFIRQILCGLKYLNDHPTRVIHYDLKPQNIIFHKGVVKISDFGLCKLIENNATRIELTSQGVGTYWYLPPECFEVKEQPPLINNKVDVWSVGVIFYEMLFGTKPFGQNMSQEKILKEGIILRSHNVVFPSKPSITPDTRDFIKRCLAYNQMDRLDVNQAYNHPYFSKVLK